jgi:hypothetical protein
MVNHPPSSFHIAGVTTALLLLPMLLMHNPVVMSKTQIVFIFDENYHAICGPNLGYFAMHSSAVIMQSVVGHQSLWRTLKAELVLEMGNH